ncbi:MAG: signal peptidase II [Acidothermaceae bacterium]
MQTTRRASISGAAAERGTSEKASAQQPSGAAAERGTSEKASAGQPSGDGATGGERHRHIGILFGVAAVVLVLDIVSKLLVVAKLSDRDPVRLLGGFLKLEETRNAGAAFSVGTGATFVFAFVAVAVIVVILRSARRLYSGPWAIVLGLLLGGATGNLIDRVVRSPGLFRGQVVDWIALPHFAVFNLADSAITVGGVVAVLLAIAGRQIDGTVVSLGSGRSETAVADAPDTKDVDENIGTDDKRDDDALSDTPDTPDTPEAPERPDSPAVQSDRSVR